MKLKMVAKSDVGVARSVNEDFCGIFEEDGLAIVCDGMGGHQAGAKASRLAVATVRYMYLFLDSSVHSQIAKDLLVNKLEVAVRLVGSVRLSNRHIYNRSLQEPELRGMGTTVSSLAIVNNIAVITHVGDSRVYRFRGDHMELLTDDHTYVNELIHDQELDPEDAKKFEKQNVITRALGLSGAVKIDVGIESVKKGDLFLLCTDGLTKALSDDEIKRIVLFNEDNFDHTINHLIDTANIKDGSDNITIAFVSVDEVSAEKNGYQSTYITLKAEDEKAARIEDKILKQEIVRQNLSDPTKTKFDRVINNRFMQWSIAAIVLVFIILIGVFATSNQRNRNSSNQPAATMPNSSSSKPDGQKPASPAQSKKQVNSYSGGILNQTAKPGVSDSANALQTLDLADMLEKEILPNNSQTSPLQQKLQNRGRVYLIGLDRIQDVEKSLLLINNRYWGRTIDFRERGILLLPGRYNIVICDSSRNILSERNNVEISAGDIKPIEFRR
jgi:protein phosphatase